MKKLGGQPKLDEVVGRIGRVGRVFSKLDMLVVFLHINYIGNQLFCIIISNDWQTKIL